MLLFCIVVLLALLLTLLFSHCSSYTIPFMLLLSHYSSRVVPNVVTLLTLLLLHYCSFLTTAGLLHYYFSHIVLLALLLLLCCYSPHIVIFTLSFFLCFRYLLAQPLLLLYSVWLIWYFPYLYHVQVKAQSFNTNLNTRGKFFCICATLAFMPFYFFIHFVLFIFIM